MGKWIAPIMNIYGYDSFLCVTGSGFGKYASSGAGVYHRANQLLMFKNCVYRPFRGFVVFKFFAEVFHRMKLTRMIHAVNRKK